MIAVTIPLGNLSFFLMFLAKMCDIKILTNKSITSILTPIIGVTANINAFAQILGMFRERNKKVPNKVKSKSGLLIPGVLLLSRLS